MPCSTIRDFVAIGVLKIVDAREHELVTRDHTGSVQQLEQACRKCLGRYLPMMAAVIQHFGLKRNTNCWPTVGRQYILGTIPHYYLLSGIKMFLKINKVSSNFSRNKYCRKFKTQMISIGVTFNQSSINLGLTSCEVFTTFLLS